jgi:hypothetical protein
MITLLPVEGDLLILPELQIYLERATDTIAVREIRKGWL